MVIWASYQLMIGCDFDNTRWSSAKGWESAKKRLAFGRAAQDGEEEGSIVLDTSFMGDWVAHLVQTFGPASGELAPAGNPTGLRGNPTGPSGSESGLAGIASGLAGGASGSAGGASENGITERGSFRH